MSQKTDFSVYLLGNPNTGKTSLFNLLTGLNQKTGNYPGITVEKKEGFIKLNGDKKIKLIDLPGTYSLFPQSYDEKVVLDELAHLKSIEPSSYLILVVIDELHLQRHLTLFSQVKDLGLNALIVINSFSQRIEALNPQKNIELENRLETKILWVNARKNKGIPRVKEEVGRYFVEEGWKNPQSSFMDFESFRSSDSKIKEELDEQKIDSFQKLFEAYSQIQFAKPEEKLNQANRFEVLENFRRKESFQRQLEISGIVHEESENREEESISFTKTLDKVLIHPVWGMVSFLAILYLVFVSIFSWSELPMTLIDEGFVHIKTALETILPKGELTNLITDGILAGINGVVIFIPQIAILFAIIAFLEESGYMARVVYMMDSFMLKFGLSGRAVIPMVSGAACAIPAIMATRNVGTLKERLITVLTIPFISCSARIPVYAILIALVIPDKSWFGVINLQALTLMGLYLLGFASALIAAKALSSFIPEKERSSFLLEFPRYRVPPFQTVLLAGYSKSKSFVLEAGKIILAISIVLWALAFYVPPGNAELAANDDPGNRLEYSYAGELGKAIEPIIQPLGFDWKIGIALITSFAAREVFVSTMATIYSVGEEEPKALIEKMRSDTNSSTGLPVFTLPAGISLMLFYAFALQCMSTVAIVKKETGGWKWPIIQFTSMAIIAYLASFLAYQLLSVG